jgi:tetratricopeptide (TPR) repeat protein
MMLRLIFPLLLLAMPSALLGQDAALLMRKGNDALASGLYEIAALHFSDCLASQNLDPKEKSEAAIRMAETLIRDGKPSKAMELLGQSFATGHPEAPFWTGLALAGLGKFTDAVSALSPIALNPEAPHRNEALFTTANLELALDKPNAALTILSTLSSSSSDPALTAKARLHQVEILLELGQTENARQTMPASSLVSPQDLPLATFLEANLLLAEKRPSEAASSFQTLVDQPQGQSLRRYHQAVIGLADAFRANGIPETATEFLLQFIQSHPDSPQLDAMFKRLQDTLPESPTLSDPILERLAQWITPAELPTTGPLATTECLAVSAWPSATQSSDLLTYSLFTRALGLHRIGTPEARAEARFLHTRLRLENPGHPLAKRALFLTAQWALEERSTSRALLILDILRECTASPNIQGEAAYLEAKTAYLQGDKNQAIPLFEEAAHSLSGENSNAARMNAAILRLGEDTTNTIPILQTDLPENSNLAADLELERALSLTDPTNQRTAIEDFLTHHPTHQRWPEARLAAAEAALAGTKPDLSFARAQLDTIAADPDASTNLDHSRLALVSLRIHDLSQDSAAAIAAARALLEKYPEQPSAAEASLILGRNLFQTRSYNDARLVLEKLASSDIDPARAQAAWLLSARAAALVPTNQSQQEALILFDKAMNSKGPVSALAKLEKARLMIDMNRLADASNFLRTWFETLPDTDPLHLPAGLLLGEATYAQGSVNPISLAEALDVYDKLLVHAEKFPSIFYRLQYMRGRTLEQLPDETNPALKRENQAFIAYYSVLETTTTPAEWQYFELCGFRALALLEKAGRWPAAIACAKKIASFKGPRAEEAATRASQLQLKHMIWED